MTDNGIRLQRKLMEDNTAMARLADAQNEEERIRLVVDYGEEWGLPVTADAVRTYLGSMASEELSDAALENVVGGKTYHCGDGGMCIGRASNLFGAWDGDDEIFGGDGRDTICAAAGDDTILGGAGGDSVYGEEGDDVIQGDGGNDFLDGGIGNDTLDGDIGNDWLLGDEGDDSLSGGSGNDNLSAGSGEDILDGGTGNDGMWGGSGSDILSGGEGNDSLYGGSGSDILTGGEGSDVFFFGNDDGNDVVTDFNPADDRLVFVGITSPSDLQVGVANGNTYIQFGDTQITLENVEMSQEEVVACVSENPTVY